MLGKNTWCQPSCGLMVPSFAANELDDLRDGALKGKVLKLFSLSKVDHILQNSHLCSRKG